MSIGQGGPQWGSGGQDGNPYGSGQQNPQQSPYGGQQGTPGPYQQPGPYSQGQGQGSSQGQGPGRGQGQGQGQGAGPGGQQPNPYQQGQPYPHPQQPPYQQQPPQTPQAPQAPQQGYQQPQRLPAASATPDWAALADASAARNRRKRLMTIVGAAVAATAVAVVTTVVLLSGDDPQDSKNAKNNEAKPTGGASASGTPGEQKPPPTAKEIVSDEKLDTAPLTVDTVFPGRKLTMGDRVYTKSTVARADACSEVTQSGLGDVLERNGCDQVLRATYGKDKIAVTVGVAVFGNEREAKKAVQDSRGNIAPLKAKGGPEFCKGGPVCRFTANSYGRYAYFTTTGLTNDKSVEKGDEAAFKAGDDVAEFVFREIVRRGEDRASAAAG
ncbi:Fis family transcriptional regulator [Streptomyces sp. NPDC000594]|uniref:Fis family transcriptional regulator n=1 Tax=Streptomyces sp. NPDC000594 TaxID=3154261 RepID=UPI003327A847